MCHVKRLLFPHKFSGSNKQTKGGGLQRSTSEVEPYFLYMRELRAGSLAMGPERARLVISPVNLINYCRCLKSLQGALGQTQGRGSLLHSDNPAASDAPCTVNVTATSESSQGSLAQHDLGEGASSEVKTASRNPLSGKKQKHVCAQCGKSRRDGVKLQACARCNDALYCVQDCQRRHWPSHKRAC